MAQEKVTIYSYYGAQAVYLGDNLIVLGDRLSALQAYKSLNYEVEDRYVDWHDMPQRLNGGGPTAPDSKAVLVAHLKDMRSRWLRKQIDDLKGQLERLEQEERDEISKVSGEH